MQAEPQAQNRRQGAHNLMAKSIEIKNFRGFRSAELSDCRRINVVVGPNGSGKTAFLEAIFFAAGASAELSLRARQWRGFESMLTSGTGSQIDESLWGDLFFNFDNDAKLSITLGGTRDHERSLKIRFLPQQETLVPLGHRRTTESDTPTLETFVHTAGVSFEWVGPYRKKIVSVARVEDGKIRFSNVLDAPIHASLFAASHTYSMLETVNRFSGLSKKMEEGEAVAAFKEQFPVVESLSLELSGGVPMIFANTASLAQKIPLNILSAGMTKLSAILFAIPTMKNGILLIDEIENGFYYDRLPAIWTALRAFSEKYDVQLFASTHSLECLRAAADVAKIHPDDFSLVRAAPGRTAREGCSLRQFTGTQFTAAIDEDIEIR
jgi:predicted ATPase